MSDTPPRIAFLPFDGFSNMVLASAVEPLRAACDLSGRRLFEWSMTTIDGAPVRSSSGLRLQADGALDAAGPLDALVVVAGYGARDAAREPGVSAALRSAAARADNLIALDMGAWILAAAGLLQGRRATVHWQEIDAFAEAFLGVEAVSESQVADGDRQSAGSASAAMALLLALIRDRAGEALAHDVGMLFAHERGAGHREDAPPRPPALGRAIRSMLKHLEEPQALGRIAQEAGVSPRALQRAFRDDLGIPAGAYYRRLRLSRAQGLALETRLPATEIAARTGFRSAATLSRAFRAHFGQTLTDARRAAARRGSRSHRATAPATGVRDRR